MFIEVLAKDGKSGLVNETEVVSIQPTGVDDKAILVMRGVDPQSKQQVILSSAMPYERLKRRLTAQTVSVAMEDETATDEMEHVEDLLCRRCNHLFSSHNEGDGCLAVVGINFHKMLGTKTEQYCDCREFALPMEAGKEKLQ